MTISHAALPVRQNKTQSHTTRTSSVQALRRSSHAAAYKALPHLLLPATSPLPLLSTQPLLLHWQCHQRPPTFSIQQPAPTACTVAIATCKCTTMQLAPSTCPTLFDASLKVVAPLPHIVYLASSSEKHDRFRVAQPLTTSGPPNHF